MQTDLVQTKPRFAVKSQKQLPKEPSHSVSSARVHLTIGFGQWSVSVQRARIGAIVSVLQQFVLQCTNTTPKDTTRRVIARLLRAIGMQVPCLDLIASILISCVNIVLAVANEPGKTEVPSF